MWLTLKVLLIGWLTIGLTVVVIIGVRRSRTNRGDPKWSRRPGGQPGYEASIRGNMPATPLPEWVDRDDHNPKTGNEQSTSNCSFCTADVAAAAGYNKVDSSRAVLEADAYFARRTYQGTLTALSMSRYPDIPRLLVEEPAGVSPSGVERSVDVF